MSLPTFLKVADVARILDSSERYVLDQIRANNLRATKVNGWRIDPDDLQTFLDAKANVSKVRR